MKKVINRELDGIRDPVIKLFFYSQSISVNKIHKVQKS